LQGQIPSCVLVDFSTQKKCCSPQKYDNWKIIVHYRC
jgi:hypothetical protein